MPVIDASAKALAFYRFGPWQTDHALPTEPALHMLGVLANHQPVANELAGHAVEHSFEVEDSEFAHPSRDFFKLCGAAHRQGLEHGPLSGQQFGHTRVHALHDSVHKGLVIGSPLALRLNDQLGLT
jgi:hypothetical protein